MSGDLARAHQLGIGLRASAAFAGVVLVTTVLAMVFTLVLVVSLFTGGG